MEAQETVEQQIFYTQLCGNGKTTATILANEYGSLETAWNFIKENGMDDAYQRLREKGINRTATGLDLNGNVSTFHNILQMNGITDMNFSPNWNMYGYIRNNRNPFHGNVLDPIKALRKKLEAAKKAAKEAEQELYKALEKEKNKRTAKYKVGDKVLIEATVSGITVGNEEPEYTVTINSAFEYGAGTQRIIKVEERKVSKDYLAYRDEQAQTGYAEIYFGEKDPTISEGFFLHIPPKYKGPRLVLPHRYTRTETEQIVAKLLNRLKEEK